MKTLSFSFLLNFLEISSDESNVYAGSSGLSLPKIDLESGICLLLVKLFKSVATFKHHFYDMNHNQMILLSASL